MKCCPGKFEDLPRVHMKNPNKMGVVAKAWNHSTGKAEADGCLGLAGYPVKPQGWVPGQ